jgi:cbb3-type cytochrome oxidase subunit 3
MTPVYQGLLQGFVTVLALMSFIGICIYAYAPSQRKRFDEASRSPIDEEVDRAELGSSREGRS